MIIFNLKEHLEVNADFQGFCLSEFNFESNKATNGQILNEFLNSTSFNFDSLPNVVKENPEEKQYLKPLFKSKKISSSDFNRFEKSGITKFLIDFLNQPDWGEDRIGFSNLLDKYFEIHNNYDESDFYLINKEWFNAEDQKIRQPEFEIYSYYFLIVYINKIKGILAITEWTYD